MVSGKSSTGSLELVRISLYFYFEFFFYKGSEEGRYCSSLKI